MNPVTFVTDAVVGLYDLGGPVVLVLFVVSIVTAAVVIYKLWQFRAAGVGRHTHVTAAVEAWDAGDRVRAYTLAEASRGYLGPVVLRALDQAASGDLAADRADAEAEARFGKLESGLGLLDIIAQLAPLMGLFGTVLGMIDAFRTLQGAGNSVDPSMLAGGIWVALLTTAAGLAVAMPTSLLLTWLDARLRRDRVLANRLLRTVFAPASAETNVVAAARPGMRHAV
ncbi:MotA/TolQ/ExbB proton channel family protein [Chachezhania sediminis]|uniref:MotA/TolQ/ExbB proton channel family protein n=1 Tax=Chachezhania sediminis TaxID=2599291 RepID=UPI00131A80C3|nr:MotA/TolQ/ExbB proton channel family protein [Chachezhania sediminis]